LFLDDEDTSNSRAESIILRARLEANENKRMKKEMNNQLLGQVVNSFETSFAPAHSSTSWCAQKKNYTTINGNAIKRPLSKLQQPK
jgi:hypothetical protein